MLVAGTYSISLGALNLIHNGKIDEPIIWDAKYRNGVLNIVFNEISFQLPRQALSMPDEISRRDKEQCARAF